MSVELAIAFAFFCFASLFTPGPNNVMLLASGLNFGVRRTTQHIIGVGFGFSFILMVVGFGLGALFQSYPVAYTVLKYVGAAYLIWLAIRIARAGPINPGGASRGRPMTFIETVLFQWVNVKGWFIAIGAIATYSTIAAFPNNIFILSAIALFFGLASALTWALFGQGLRHVLSSPKWVRVFNIGMAIALVASLYPVFRG